MTKTLVALACLMLAGATRGQERAVREAVPPLLVVTGTGEYAAAPDRAILRLGATAQADKAEDAQSRVNEAVQKVIDAVKEAGVRGGDITTSGLTLSPTYTDPARGRPPKISGYQASNTVEVVIEDLKKVGPVIDATVAAGANQIESLTFDLKDDTEARSKALERAVHDARAKAEVLARAAGVGLGALHDLDATSLPGPIPFARAMRADAAMAATPVEPGQVRVSASVTLRYAIVAK